MIPWRLISTIDVASAAALLAGLALSFEAQAKEQRNVAPSEASASSAPAPSAAPGGSEPPAPQRLQSSGGAESSGKALVVRSGDAPAVAPAGVADSPDPPGVYSAVPSGVVASGTQFDELEDTHPSALTDFNESLEPYGRWVEHSKFGTVWVPDSRVVGTQFAPYVTRGRWALTADNQWLWQSDYPFGGVTFHYGRWAWADAHGWAWIPGRQYSPAWVNFRVGHSTHVGWAPMAPRYIWRRGSLAWLNAAPPSAYVFVPVNYAFYPSLQSYVIFQHFRVRSLMARSRAYFPRGIRRRHHRNYYSPSLRHVPARARPRARVRAQPGLRFRRFRAGAPQRTKALPRVQRPVARPRQRGAERAGGAARPSRSLKSARTVARPSSAQRPAKRLKPRKTSRTQPGTAARQPATRLKPRKTSRARPKSAWKRSRAKKSKSRQSAASLPAKTKTSQKAPAKSRSSTRSSRTRRSSTGRSSSGRTKAKARRAR